MIINQLIGCFYFGYDLGAKTKLGWASSQGFVQGPLGLVLEIFLLEIWLGYCGSPFYEMILYITPLSHESGSQTCEVHSHVRAVLYITITCNYFFPFIDPPSLLYSL